MHYPKTSKWTLHNLRPERYQKVFRNFSGITRFLLFKRCPVAPKSERIFVKTKYFGYKNIFHSAKKIGLYSSCWESWTQCSVVGDHNYIYTIKNLKLKIFMTFFMPRRNIRQKFKDIGYSSCIEKLGKRLMISFLHWALGIIASFRSHRVTLAYSLVCGAYCHLPRLTS